MSNHSLARERGPRSWTAALLLLFALSLASCHSLAGIRVDQRVQSGDRTAVLAVWCKAPESILSDGGAPVYEAVVALLPYPVDVLASTYVAVHAPFDEKLEVRGGPAGALAGICLPWVTLVPYIHPPFHLMMQPKQVELAPAQFEQLLQRVRAGDGVAAYAELGSGVASDCVYAVELVEMPRGDESGR